VELEEVLKSDPLSLWSRLWLACMYVFMRQPERVVAEGHRMIELNASHPFSHWVLGMGQMQCGHMEAAVSALEEANRLSGGLAITSALLAYAYGRAGRHEEARAFVASGASRGRYIAPTISAFALLGLEQWDAAFEWLDRAIDERDPLIVPIKSYEMFDPIRDDPRFAGLLRKMNLA
jgi:adenylate cyclase